MNQCVFFSSNVIITTFEHALPMHLIIVFQILFLSTVQISIGPTHNSIKKNRYWVIAFDLAHGANDGFDSLGRGVVVGPTGPWDESVRARRRAGPCT